MSEELIGVINQLVQADSMELTAFFRKNQMRLEQLVPVLDKMVDPSLNFQLYVLLLQNTIQVANPLDAVQFEFVQRHFARAMQQSEIKAVMIHFQTVSLLSQVYTEFLLNAKKPMHGIGVLLQTIERVAQNNPQTQGVSRLHSNVALLCLKAKCYQHAVKLIDQPILNVLPGTQAIDVMAYNYFRGMLFIGLQRYEDAIKMFDKVMVQPSSTIHQYHVDAFKKATLVSLIARGSKYQVPEKAPPKVRNAVAFYSLQREIPYGVVVAQVHSYHTINEAYVRGDVNELSTVIQGHLEELQADKNFGLAKKVLQRLKQKNIKDLSDVYLTLGFKDLEALTMTEASKIESTLIGMVREGLVQIKIDKESKTVNFIDPEQVVNESEPHEAAYQATVLPLIETLERQSAEVVALMEKVDVMNNGIKLSEDYLQRKIKFTKANDNQNIDREGDDERMQYM